MSFEKNTIINSTTGNLEMNIKLGIVISKLNCIQQMLFKENLTHITSSILKCAISQHNRLKRSKQYYLLVSFNDLKLLF